ncbi:helix-turn-helix transcriptional regulator [Solihabitans fulvus]|uniref:Helix-turn-helix transcriptional regulator n=1 Tax=Solihabitans fulvus TaxID=1892852 RepID=A0A5B2X0U8_9PSEU|nr:helix-turn-helix domain-containing protein [Solihabitans fulvus]KAA2256954.1 helix-turn-helix transcriptional regulator [Solihabitans fulvus]
MEQDTDTDGGRSLADKLNHLFQLVRPAAREEYSYEEVAASIREQGISISHTYVWQLRKGIRTNPTKRHLEGLAAFFGVSPAYFFDDSTSAQVDTELALLAALRDGSVRQVALRVADLSPASLDTVNDLVDRIRQLEGLPPANGDSPRPPGQ